MPKVKLQSSDGEVFEVDTKIAKQSTTLKTMLDNLGEEGDEVIPITKVNAVVLGKVLEWATYHQNDQPPVEDPITTREPDSTLDPWDKDFLDVDQTMLFEILLAANYLEIKGLYEASCKAVANLIRGKTPDEIRSTLGIVNNFTPEEEKQIRADHDWEEKPREEE